MLDVLAKQAESLSLAGQLALAKPALEALLEKLAAGGAAADKFGLARSARTHMFMANVLSEGDGQLVEAKEHLTRALELHKAAATDDHTSVEASMCANMRAALLRAPRPASNRQARH